MIGMLILAWRRSSACMSVVTAPSILICARRRLGRHTPAGVQNGYRVSHDRGDVTAGNETPGWPWPAPGSATTTSSAIPGLAGTIMLVCGLVTGLPAQAGQETGAAGTPGAPGRRRQGRE
jgi:hypothetical protein